MSKPHPNHELGIPQQQRYRDDPDVVSPPAEPDVQGRAEPSWTQHQASAGQLPFRSGLRATSQNRGALGPAPAQAGGPR